MLLITFTRSLSKLSDNQYQAKIQQMTTNWNISFKPSKQIIVKRIFLFIISAVFCQALYSQNSKQYMNIADEAFGNNDYSTAAAYYFRALEITRNEYTEFKYAEASRLLNNYEEAEKYYKIVANSKNSKDYPLSKFWLGIVEKDLGLYQKAQKNFREYYVKHKNQKDYYAQKSLHEIYSCEQAIYLSFDYKNVMLNKFSGEINSSYSEFKATDINDSILYFSSLHPENDSDSNYNSKIYIAFRKDTSWINISALDSTINKKHFNVANFSFSPDHETMFFSLGGKNNKTSSIYKSRFSGGKWGNPEKLPESINKENAYVTQPSFSRFHDRDYLLFVSDMTGGFGKLDIWYCEINKDGTYGRVTNAGSHINSIDNDVTPYYNEADSSLFFSSEWFDNLGGYDIFRSKGNFVTWTDPVNLGIPINSSNNDLYYNLNQTGTKAYFSSNRSLSKGGKNETCCNDLYFIPMKNPANDSIIKKLL